jgi:hypothetical protein
MGVFNAQDDGGWPKQMEKAGFAWQEVSPADRPTVVILPGFAPPGILSERPLTDLFQLTRLVAYIDDAARKPATPPGTEAAVFQPFRPDILCRVLAKIAHGAAVAELGLGGFQPFLPDLILGRSTYLSHFVGSPLYRRPRLPAVPRYEISLTLRQGYVVAVVRLFADLGLPPYEVIVGPPTPTHGPMFAVATRFSGG